LWTGAVVLLAVSAAALAGRGSPPRADEATIRRLIEQLGDPAFTKREEAAGLLRKIGLPALPLLRRAAAEAKHAEVQRRAARLAETINNTAFSQVRTFDAPRLRGRLGWLQRLVVTPDGKQAVTAGERLAVWDCATGKELRSLGYNRAGYWALALSGDGKRVIAGSNDGNAYVWDLASGRQLARLQGHKETVWGAALTGDGKRAVTGSWDGTLRVWDVATARETLPFKRAVGKVRCLALSPDGKRVASGDYRDGAADAFVRLWDLETGAEVFALKGHTKEVTAVAFSPTGDTLVSSSFDGSVRLWDVRAGRATKVLEGHTARVEAAVFSADGSKVLSCGDEADRSVRVWDAASGQELYRSETVASGSLGLAALPDGRHALSSGKDGRIRLWRWAK
jgi:tricorn protease-like protein